MQGRRDRHRRRRQEGGGWGWLVLAALALVLTCRDTPPAAALEDRLQTFWQQLQADDALETLGRSITHGAGAAIETFGQQILGIGE